MNTLSLSLSLAVQLFISNKNSAMAEQVQETSLQVVNKNTRLGETDVQDCSLWHHLIFRQELEIDDQKQDLCWLCNEPASGSPNA
jgi:hypothetical protein